ncbi:MAG: 1-acyl-sn-glycerol-3-phosphate acyltransferase [Bacteroidales bacterium]|nr:1-acyl-sn-glycerol-3-phosphate acyltransferase [Bacteroidales bacterium]
MKNPFERFDMAKDPIRTRWFLKPITKLLSFPDMLRHSPIIRRHGTENLKPPYVLLCNHNAFLDFKVANQVIYPDRANYVVAIDGFIGREWLLRNVGCICKRKFTNDTVLVRQLAKVVENKDIAVVYPEARYSLCGTTAVLPASLGKLCKMLNVPVATLICHGHHVNSPFWNLKGKSIRHTEADFDLQFTAEQLREATVDEINDRLVAAFQYDDFAWQKEKGAKVFYRKRAEGLHKVLYQCPACGTEYEMTSKGTRIRCNHCGKEWEMTELGELKAVSGETEFSHIPDWYEWERANVRKEVEEGRYSSGELPVVVDTLPNAKKFIRLGEGTLVHDMQGFHVHGTDVDGDPFDMEIPVPALYSVHIEYEYLGKHGDCVDLNTLEDTWYIYPHDRPFAVTKMALATEELYFAHRRAIGKPCRPGLA